MYATTLRDYPENSYIMNAGQPSDAPVSPSPLAIINSLDEVTREKVLAELPDDVRRRIILEQQAAAFLAAARLNLAPTEMIASGFLNMPSPEAMINHNISLVKVPGGGLAHAMIQPSPSLPNQVCLVRNPGMGHNHGAPIAHYIASRIPVSPMENVGFCPTQVNGATMNAVIVNPGSAVRIPGPNLGQGMYTRSLAAGVSFNFGSKGPPAAGSPSQVFNPRASVVHNGGTGNSGATRQMGPVSPINMQIGLVPGNSVHYAAQRYPNLPGTFSPGLNGHILRQRPVISTYLDDFKNGFPTQGLSVVSNHWWGGAEPDKASEESEEVRSLTLGNREDATQGFKAGSDPGGLGSRTVLAKSKKKNIIEVLRSCRKVTKARKLAATSGKRALRLGVAKGYGMQKLEQKEAAILQFVFGKFLPRQWTAALPETS